MNIKDKKTLQIETIMTKKLKLSGLPLLAYAVVYHSTNKGEKPFIDNDELLYWLGCGKFTLNNIIKALIKTGLLVSVKTESALTFSVNKAYIDVSAKTSKKE